ncbi:signal peptidase II [Arthrobacter sp. H20]|uniref:signal peptidase II n=1 Tax=Arthrobacter sp. H20 TaxID=1267981 RepID=UPI0004787441|nr:signal peptidase II [Arthrobacter sp. H20]
MTDQTPERGIPAGSDEPTTDDRDESTPASHRRRTGARYALLFAACFAVIYAADQLTKIWVVSTMTEGQITPVLPPLLNWHFIRNPGAAFSIGTNYTWVFTIIMVVVSIAILTQVRKVASWWWATALGLVFAGAVGNLTDRLLREPSFGQGHVVDFIALPNFAIFNIADSAVVTGVGLICVLTLRGVGLDGKRSNDEPPGDGTADAK